MKYSTPSRLWVTVIHLPPISLGVNKIQPPSGFWLIALTNYYIDLYNSEGVEYW